MSGHAGETSRKSRTGIISVAPEACLETWRESNYPPVKSGGKKWSLDSRGDCDNVLRAVCCVCFVLCCVYCLCVMIFCVGCVVDVLYCVELYCVLLYCVVVYCVVLCMLCCVVWVFRYDLLFFTLIASEIIAYVVLEDMLQTHIEGIIFVLIWSENLLLACASILKSSKYAKHYESCTVSLFFFFL